MENVPQDILNEFMETCREAARRGLVRCSSGNLSLRLDNEHMLITCSRSWMGRITPEEVCVCRVADGSLVTGPAPSAETGFHAGILRTRPDMNVVLHFQSSFATTLACRQTAHVDYAVIPEMPFYIGPVAEAEYSQPGSMELAAAMMEAISGHEMVMMRNHGQTTVAVDLAHAIQNAAFFELACEIIVRGGDDIRPISESVAAELNALRRSGSGPGA